MRDNNGRKGVINFIVKVITPDMRWFNINVLHVEASNTEGTLAFVRYTNPPTQIWSPYLRDAFFVGVAVVVDCLFSFSQ